MNGYTLTTSEAAVVCGVSDKSIRRWVDEGKLRHVRLPSGQLRFSVADLEAVLTPIEVTP